MNLSPFSTPSATPQRPWFTSSIDTELVRGTEESILDRLQPVVRRESVALDLSQVGRIDARGIAVLITLFCTARQAGNNFTIVQPSSHVLELLQIVGLDSILLSSPEVSEDFKSAQTRAFAPELDDCVACPAA